MLFAKESVIVEKIWPKMDGSSRIVQLTGCWIQLAWNNSGKTEVYKFIKKLGHSWRRTTRRNCVTLVIWSILTLWWVLRRMLRSTYNLSNCRVSRRGLRNIDGSMLQNVNVLRIFNVSRLRMLRIFSVSRLLMLGVMLKIFNVSRMIMLWIFNVSRMIVLRKFADLNINLESRKPLTRHITNMFKKMQPCRKSLISWRR